MKKITFLLLLILASCNSTNTQNELLGEWKVTEDQTVYQFSEDQLSMLNTVDVGRMILKAKTVFKYKIDKDELKLTFLKSEVNHTPKKISSNVTLRDTYAKSDYNGPKEMILKYKIENKIMTLLMQNKPEIKLSKSEP